MANLIELQDGEADYMGDGFYLVRQRDERGEGQSVGLSEDDLRAMLAAIPGGE
jgi:hypothetical protein